MCMCVYCRYVLYINKIIQTLIRISNSQLEVDAVAADILNSNDLLEGAMNPGLKVGRSEVSVVSKGRVVLFINLPFLICLRYI